MGKLFLYINLVQSLLGILFGISGFIVFYFVYGNIVASIWTLVSGIFAAVCFHLHYLKWRNKLDIYHSIETIEKLTPLGFTVLVVAFLFFIWYIFAVIYWHIPMVPVKTSSVINAVWAFMTAKWGLHLYLMSIRYRKLMTSDSPPLLA